MTETMSDNTIKMIASLKSLEEIKGWRSGVSLSREYQDGEQAALVEREKQILEGRA